MKFENEEKKTPRVYSVEFWRFAFTVIVALYHLEIFYQKKLMPSGTGAVEFFFILAGFTIAMSASRRMARDGLRELSARDANALAWGYLKKKLRLIYPALAVTLVITLVVIPLSGAVFTFGSADVNAGFLPRLFAQIKLLLGSEWEWLMMVGTPMGFNNASAASAPIVPLWFLTQLLLVGYLCTFLINRKYDFTMFAAPLIGVLGLTYFVLNSENNLDFYIKMGLVNAGTVRAVTEIAMGITAYRIYEYMIGREWKLPGKIALQLLELLAVYRYCALTFNAPLSIENFRRIPYILIIILLSFVNVTLLSKLLNRKFMEKAGKLSLTMYLVHFPVATVYYYFIYTLKMKPAARALPSFFMRSGGADRMYPPIPLSLGDVVMYLPFVIVVSVLINLLISGITRLFRRAAAPKNIKKTEMD